MEIAVASAFKLLAEAAADSKTGKADSFSAASWRVMLSRLSEAMEFNHTVSLVKKHEPYCSDVSPLPTAQYF